MKQSKNELRRDTVKSDSFHVGIELELKTPGDGRGHDDEACDHARRDQERDYLEGLIVADLIDHCLGVSVTRAEGESLSAYLDTSQIIRDYMDNYESECDGDCYHSNDGSSTREDMRVDLKTLTGNTSFKVVSDSSINTEDYEVDTEVCWNYFASKDTLRDNEKIMAYLKEKGSNFDTSCGLHINLNNYLKLPNDETIPVKELSFLFDFVAESRRESTYCSREGMSGGEKYSMLYNQGDRVEFRFFSPTLDAEKLNHYVTLANVVYRRLCGKNVKLPKKSELYFMEKIETVNKRGKSTAKAVIKKLNNLKSYNELTNAHVKRQASDLLNMINIDLNTTASTYNVLLTESESA